jgi:hypothetical protein
VNNPKGEGVGFLIGKLGRPMYHYKTGRRFLEFLSSYGDLHEVNLQGKSHQ